MWSSALDLLHGLRLGSLGRHWLDRWLDRRLYCREGFSEQEEHRWHPRQSYSDSAESGVPFGLVSTHGGPSNVRGPSDETLTYLRRSIHDPMPGTQIASVAFQDRAAKAMSNQQSFRLYYQQVDGATREMRYDSPSPGWQNATTIFTDAKNYTGMASFTYLNGTERNVRGMNLGEYTKGTDMEAMPQIFVVYVDSNNVLQGRRKTPFDPVWASSSPLAKKGFHADGSSGNVAGRAGLGLTAVYSTDFASGAGARVFYHAQPSDPSKSKGWVQELIWDEKGDSWSLGARIQDVAPTSQLAAVVNGQFLRLFYSTGQRKLQESWTNITDPKGNYTKGMFVCLLTLVHPRDTLGNFPDFWKPKEDQAHKRMNTGISKDDLLPTDESSISALTLARSVILYYNDLRGDVREVNITGIPNSPKQTVDTSSSIIVTGGAPKYPTSIGSVVGTASDSAEQVHVFATDHPGSEAEGMTISVIAHMTRNISQPTWPTTTAFNAQDRLPLGLHSK